MQTQEETFTGKNKPAGLATKLGLGLSGALLLGILFWLAYTRNPWAIDWHHTYYPSTRALIGLRTPYAENGYFFAPFWSLIPLIPFALLPEDAGRALFFVASLLGFAWLAYRAGAKPVAMAAFLLSAPAANCIQTGNIEWIPLLGAFMPAPIGLVFLTMKPQSTVGVILLVLYRGWKQGQAEFVKVILPTAILGAASWLIYGPWFLNIGGAFNLAGAFVVSPWPLGIPVGLALLYLAVQKDDLHHALAASPWLSPYAILLTWSGFMLSFVRSNKGMAAASAASWVLWALFRWWIGI